MQEVDGNLAVVESNFFFPQQEDAMQRWLLCLTTLVHEKPSDKRLTNAITVQNNSYVFQMCSSCKQS